MRKPESDFQKAIELAPNNLEPYINLGEVYVKQKSLDQALVLYDTLVKEKPDNPTPSMLSGMILEAMDRGPGSLATL